MKEWDIVRLKKIEKKYMCEYKRERGRERERERGREREREWVSARVSKRARKIAEESKNKKSKERVWKRYEREITINNLTKQFEEQTQDVVHLQQKLANTPISIILAPPTPTQAAALVNSTIPLSDQTQVALHPVVFNWQAAQHTPSWKSLHLQIGQPAIDAHHHATI